MAMWASERFKKGFVLLVDKEHFNCLFKFWILGVTKPGFGIFPPCVTRFSIYEDGLGMEYGIRD